MRTRVVLEEHNAFPIDKRELFSEEFVLNSLKLIRVDIGDDHLANWEAHNI